MNDSADHKVNCAAYGCPMIGVCTRSTNGTKEWLCHLHMSSDSSRWQAITAELNRLSWLVGITRLIREHGDGPTWPKHAAGVHRDIGLAQRNDLKANDKDRSVKAWGIRLEGVLSQSCASIGSQPELRGEA